MTKQELEQLVKELEARNKELESQVKELAREPDCEGQKAPLLEEIEALSTKNKSLGLTVNKLTDENKSLAEKLSEMKKAEQERSLKESEKAEGELDFDTADGLYSDEQLAKNKTGLVVIDDITGLTRMPDGSVVKSQFVAKDISDVGLRRVMLIGIVNGKVTINGDLTGIEISTYQENGETKHKLQAV